jgi:hypothetical protein
MQDSIAARKDGRDRFRDFREIAILLKKQICFGMVAAGGHDKTTLP